MTAPTTISARMATILMSANQNSISPKLFTLTALSRNTTTSTATVGSHRGTEGHQNCTYPVMATSSAIAVTIQQNQ